jgi:hypothetical protein
VQARLICALVVVEVGPTHPYGFLPVPRIVVVIKIITAVSWNKQVCHDKDKTAVSHVIIH